MKAIKDRLGVVLFCLCVLVVGLISPTLAMTTLKEKINENL